MSAEISYQGIDEMRQACGGAGFTNYAAIADVFADVAPGPTYEGINVVMLQQSARYLFKQCRSLQKGKTLTGFFEYMNRTKELCSTKSSAKTVEEFLDFDHIDQAMATRSAYYIDYTFKLMSESNEPTKVKDNELFAFEVQKMSKMHISYIMFKTAKSQIDLFKFKDDKLKPLVELLIKLFAVNYIREDPVDLFEIGFFGRGSSKLIDAAFKKLLVDLRP